MTHLQEKEFALDLVKQLRDAGYEALWAGGCVRDLLMGHQPTDYDIATSATPEQVRRLFGRRRTLPVGVAFGVVIVLGPSKRSGQVEVATFRTDSTYSDGRRPDAVAFSTAEADAQRRDFTINGMFLDPIRETVIDYVGGQADLRQGVVRAIGDAEARLAEDKLRMLRAIRFAARFHFAIERQTRQAVARHAAEVTQVSGERIHAELRKTLETDRSAWAVAEWAELGLLDAI
ncbi:MAG: CCA tRNA nucleotidyltransferase, partial [Planctomycetales bacterium]|nr:CCA tRNA nucleotidyltransferase [Planctomycetales bacterium]